MDLSIKNIILAGIGSMAQTYEKAEGIITDMVAKGELTIKQGKELNEELKINLNNKKENESITPDKLKEIISELNLATKSELDNINKRLEQLEEKISNQK